MLDRKDVAEAVRAHLEREGFELMTPGRTGVDVLAQRAEMRLLIRVTGETSSRKTARAGEEFEPRQVLDHVANAVYRALCLNEEKGARDAVVLVFPDNAAHRECVMPILGGLSRLDVRVLWVQADRTIAGDVG